MALHDPVAVYNAASNMEAHLICQALASQGIEAFASEDVSQVGTWVGGLVPEIHKPQVWVERADMDRVKPILEEFEKRARDLQKTGQDGEDLTDSMDVVCEECEKTTSYPVTQRGSVQTCPHCGAYVDVESEESLKEWDEELSETPGEDVGESNA